MLDFKYKVFFSAARHLSFSKAAKELSVSQPGVSFQIRNLEEEFGRLFVRYPNRIELTPVGTFLYKELERFGRESDAAMQRVMEKLGSYRGTIVVGASTTIGDFFLPPVIAGFKRRRPLISIKALVGNTDQVLGYLSDGIVDFAIVEGPVAASRQLVKEELFRDELVVIAPPGFHRGRKIEAAEVTAQPFIAREAGSGTRAVTDSLIAGGKPLVGNIVLELGSHTAIKRAVEAGLGITIMSIMTLGHELKLGTLKALRIKGFPICRSISVVFQRGAKRSASVKEFVDLCRDHGAKVPVSTCS